MVSDGMIGRVEGMVPMKATVFSGEVILGVSIVQTSHSNVYKIGTQMSRVRDLVEATIVLACNHAC